ncbi:chromatin modification-related protein EAF3 [Nematostella vectensis]|nr:chromatin modification-related protein EAF3 [Nematostella vectensis]
MAGHATRSLPTPKHEQGDTVLCYEPDPTKARVLYEAKVLEVDITKDEKGKKVPEYFIHFNGWNKSWDRWVVEESVLKNSEANQALKAKLHENALKYQKKRKQQRTSTSTTPVDQETTTPTDDITSNQSDLPKVEIEIPSQLKLKLEDDCYLIKRKKKLIKLPRHPCVYDVLEEYFSHCKLTQPEESCNLIREVLDGLRIYFDFTLPTLLLYNFEREQYYAAMQVNPDPLGQSNGPQRPVAEQAPADEKCGVVSSSTEASLNNTSSTSNQKERERRSSRRRTLRNHPTQAPDETSSDQTFTEQEDPSSQSVQSETEGSQSAMVSSTSSTPDLLASPPVKRKVHSIEEVPSDPPAQPRHNLSLSSTCSSLPITSGLLPATCKTMPSRIYGPEHLLRLFVKLPSLLARTNMPEKNLVPLLEQVDLLLKYLVERENALFSDDVYQSFL